MKNAVHGRTKFVYEDHGYQTPSMAELELPDLDGVTQDFHSGGLWGWLTKRLFAVAGYNKFRRLGASRLYELLNTCHFRGFGLPPNQFATVLLKDEEPKGDYVDRAARITLSTLRFRHKYLRGEITPDTHNGAPKEMGHYANLFGTHQVFFPKNCLYKSDADRFINVVVRGIYYILDVKRCRRP